MVWQQNGRGAGHFTRLPVLAPLIQNATAGAGRVDGDGNSLETNGFQNDDRGKRGASAAPLQEESGSTPGGARR